MQVKKPKNMQWRDEGIIVNIRQHGENHAIVELFTHRYGRWPGMLHGAASRARRAWLQPGNIVHAAWRARTAEQLGTWALEPLAQHAAVALGGRVALAVVQALQAELALCPERAPHPPLFDGAKLVLEHLGDSLTTAALLARFELALLEQLGYGLDLDRCALTGRREDLAWVSPKSGRAASREAGAAWADRLLPLPAFLLDANRQPSAREVAEALRLTAHFLEKRLFTSPEGALPVLRQRLPQMLLGKTEG